VTTRIVHRPARTVQPPAPQDTREVEAPPTLPDGNSQQSPLMAVLPMVGMMASLTIMMVVRNPAFIVFGAVILVVAVFAALGMFFSRRGQAARQRRNQRELYLEYLEELRDDLARAEREARARARLLAPPPEALYDIVRDPARLWERRRRDRDFLRVRIGTGEVPARPLALADRGSALTPTDPFMASEADAVIHRFSTAPDMPLAVPLDRVGDVSLVGSRPDVLRLVRALLAQAAVFHAPEDLALAVAHPAEHADDWSWLKWLPHTADADARAGGRRLIAPTPAELGALLADELRSRTDLAGEIRRGMGRREAYAAMRRLLIVHDTHGKTAADLVRPDDAIAPGALGATVLHLVERQVDEPGEVSVRITVDGDRAIVQDLRGEEEQTSSGTVDDVTPALLAGLVRMAAPLRLSAEAAEESAAEAGAADFTASLGIADPGALDVPRLWASRSERAFLRVPIGTDDTGRPLVLDLKEAAQLGMGPHGLCVGATGSGKSELLRTLVLSLAATHSPDDLSMVLADYKGGATFAPFAGLPHVAGLITNLEDDAALIERAYASLSGEVQRRQQVLKDAGNVASIGDYAHLRRKNPDLAPLPHLLVIIDEFGELLTARPDFIDLFLSIGRIGRSIGVHLLLSSQRIEGGKLRGLDTYLSYRLGLRTFSEEESRTVLDSPDAFHLPALPGFGYLKVDTTVYRRFKAGYVSGPFRGALAAEEERDTAPRPREFTAFDRPEDDRDAPVAEEPAMPERSAGPSLLEVMVGQLSGHGTRARGVWLPPLPSAVPLDGAVGAPAEGPGGLRLPGDRAPMRVPIGLLDDPAKQWQGVWELDLTASGGHAAFIGGPQTGKTTLLRTLVLSLALTHSPEQVAVYGLDLVGGGLQALTELPHVGGVAGRLDRERVRRTAEEVCGMLEHRAEVFRERGIDSVDRLRRMHARGEVPELPTADVVLVVDGFGAIRKDFEEIDELVTDVLQRGGGYGVHVVAAMLRWNDVRMATQSTFGQKVELRLNDPADSTVDRKLAGTFPPDAPGRALTDAELFGQVALPRIDGLQDASDLGEAVEKAAREAAGAWGGARVPRVRVLPRALHPGSLPGPDAEPAGVPLGVDEKALAPVVLDLFDRDQNLLVLGDGECGKTNLLRLLAAGLTARYAPEEVVFAVMDPRRTLKDAIPEPYLGGYAGSPRLCAGLAAGVAKELEERNPDGSGDRPSGPRIVVLADDYDLLTTAGQKPLAPFVPFAAAGRDIGLHFVLARRVAGASRGMYDPLVQAVRESGSTALLMSGDRGEGQILPRLYTDAQPPGRGRWVRRGSSPVLVQTALLDPPPDAGR